MALATVNSLFPVYAYEEGMDLPKEGTYFVVAGNGLWMHKDTGIVRSFVPVKNISCLEDLKAEVELECKLPKIPARLVWRVKEFFRRVVEVHRAESEVTLYYSKETGEFRVHVPHQQVSHGGVRYERVGLTHLDGMESYLRVGTIHSHCDFGAFHSGTDVGDEEDFDGIHVTFGHNDRDDFTISASVVVNGHRSAVAPESILDGIVPVTHGTCHGDRVYTLADITLDRREHEWAEGIDGWMKRVTGSWGTRFNPAPDFAVGDKVQWASDTNPLAATVGAGPFEVVETNGGAVVIKCNVGRARLSEKMFKEAKS